MRKSKKEKLLLGFEKKDSRQIDLWPRVGVEHGCLVTYVRVKRHGNFFLVKVGRRIEGPLQSWMASYEVLHLDAFKHYKHCVIDLKIPRYESVSGDFPSAYLDENQEEYDHSK